MTCLDEVLGEPRCPKCNYNLRDDRDIWETMHLKDHTLDYVEVSVICPNEDCQENLIINYSRTCIELAKEEN